MTGSTAERTRCVSLSDDNGFLIRCRLKHGHKGDHEARTTFFWTDEENAQYDWGEAA